MEKCSSLRMRKGLHGLAVAGAPTSEEIYEFWLSIKYNGNPYSKKDGEGLFVDRLLLRHAKMP